MTAEEGFEQVDGVRLVVDPATFATWIRDVPGVVLPPDFDGIVGATGSWWPSPSGDPAPEPARARPAVQSRVPPAAAASLAVQAAADVAIRLRLWGPDGTTVACVAVAGDLCASLARLERDEPDEDLPPRVEVALMPLGSAVAEVVRLIPACPPRAEGIAAAGLHVEVVATEDAVARWQDTWVGGGQRWRRVLPSGAEPGLRTEPCSLEDLAADLRYVLAGSTGTPGRQQ